jgi:hypothetical protein
LCDSQTWAAEQFRQHPGKKSTAPGCMPSSTSEQRNAFSVPHNRLEKSHAGGQE